MLVLVLGIRPGILALPRDELGVVLIECVEDVFEKDQPKDNMLVLHRVHVVPELVGRLPEFGLKAKVGCGFSRPVCLLRAMELMAKVSGWTGMFKDGLI